MDDDYEVTFTVKVRARSEYTALTVASSEMMHQLSTRKLEDLQASVKKKNWIGREDVLGSMT